MPSSVASRPSIESSNIGLKNKVASSKAQSTVGSTSSKANSTKPNAAVQPSSVKANSTIKRAPSTTQSDEDHACRRCAEHDHTSQAGRAYSAASTFVSGILAISASQMIGAPLKFVQPQLYESYMAWTKESFAILMTAITQWWAPTPVNVSGDDSMKGQLFQMDDGSLRCNFPHRLVLMANHQLYTDWLYLWWIAYTNKMHGHIYIIMKESLKQLPIFGWAAQFYNFIFLSRKWETDKLRLKSGLEHLQNPQDPMWLLIFPEGTNLSAQTREKSKAWSIKSGIPDMKHQLLPRTTGLRVCLSELSKTTNWLYDCTVAYDGIPDGQYGQDVFTLKSSLFEGKPPKSVNFYWRRFKISEIPINNEAAFSRWLMNRWREKDYLLEYFYKFKHFPANGSKLALDAVYGKVKPNHANEISTEISGGGQEEFLGIFDSVTTAAKALSSFDMTEPINVDHLLAGIAQQQLKKIADATSERPALVAGQQMINNVFKAAKQGQLDKQQRGGTQDKAKLPIQTKAKPVKGIKARVPVRTVLSEQKPRAPQKRVTNTSTTSKLSTNVKK